MTKNQRIAGIELGGNKIVCGITTSAGDVLEQTSIPTSAPDETFINIKHWLESRLTAATSLGVAGCGSVCVAAASPRFGHIGATPKTAWQGFALLKAIREWTAMPLVFGNDVNAAALVIQA